MTILESLKKNLIGVDCIETTDLIHKIQFDTGLTYESIRCNTFRYKEKLPNWFSENYTYVSYGLGRRSLVKKGGSKIELKFNKDFIYDFLFNDLDRNYYITTFPCQYGEDVKYLLNNGFVNINCIEKNLKNLEIYKNNGFNTNDYNYKFTDIINYIKTDVLYYDSCSHLNKCHIKDLEVMNELDTKYNFITFKNINNKLSNNNLTDFIKSKLYNYFLIDKKEYISMTQKMIVFNFEKKI
jgi:hypothetical protein